MKVKCLKSCAGPGINLAIGKEYDLTPEQVKAVGSSVMVIEAEKPAPVRKPKPASKAKPRKAAAKPAE